MAENSSNDFNKIAKSLFEKISIAGDVTASATEEFAIQLRSLVAVFYGVQEGIVQSTETIEKLLNDLTNGKNNITDGKLTSKNIKKTLRDLKLTEDQINEIYEVRKKLDEFGEDELIRSKDLYKIYRSVVNLDERKAKITNDLTKAYDSLVNSIQQFKFHNSGTVATLSKSEGLISRISMLAKGMFENDLIDSKKIQSSLDLIKDVATNYDTVSFDINGKLVNREDIIKDFQSLASTQIKLIEEESKMRQNKLQQYVALMKGAVISVNELSGKTELFSKRTGTRIEGNDYTKLLSDIKNVSSDYEWYIQQIAAGNKLTADQMKLLGDIGSAIVMNSAKQENELALLKAKLTANVKLSENLENQLRLLQSISPAIEAGHVESQNFTDSLEKVADGMSPFFKKLTGVEGAIEHVKASTTKAFSEFNQKILEGKGTSTAFGSSILTWGKNVLTSFGPVAAISLLLVGMFKTASMMAGKYREISETFGITKRHAKDLFLSNVKFLRSSKNQLVLAKDMLEIQHELVKGSGGQTFNLQSAGGQKLAQKLSHISLLTGKTNEETVELYETYSRLGADKKFATQLILSSDAMAEMAGIAPGIITNDLIKNAEVVSTYFAGLPDKAAEAAVNIRKLGMDIGTAGSIADRMLNLDAFMTDMFELQAMTNGNIDLSKAFDLGIAGDLEGMTKEIMEQIGTLDELNNMDFLSRKKLAATLGMSTDQLSQSVMLQEKMKNMSADERKIIEANRSTFEKMANLSDEELKKQVAMVEPTQKLNKAWEDIKGAFIKGIAPLAEKFVTLMSDLSPVVSFLSSTFSAMGSVLAVITKLIGGIAVGIGKIVGFLTGSSSPSEKLKDTATAASSLDSGMSILGTTIGGVIASIYGFKAIRGIFGMGKSAVDGLTKSFGGIKSAVETSMKTVGGFKDKLTSMTADKITGKAGSVVDSIAGKLTGKTETIQEAIPPKSKVDKLRDLAKGRVRDAKGRFMKVGSVPIPSSAPTTDITTQLDTQMKTVEDTTTQLNNRASKFFNTIGSTFKSGIDMFKEIGMSLINFFKEIGNSLISSVGSMFKSAMDIVVSAAKSIGDVISNVLKGIGSGLSSFAPTALIGVAAIIGLAGALWIGANAVDVFASGLAKLEPIVGTIFEGLSGLTSSLFRGVIGFMTSLAGLNIANMLALGPALVGISAGLLAITSSSILSGITGFFAGDPFKKLYEVAEIASPLQIVSESVQVLADGIRYLSDALKNIKTDNIDSLSKLSNIRLGSISKSTVGVSEPPSGKATAQNVSVSKLMSRRKSADELTKEDVIDNYYSGKSSEGMGGSNRKIEDLLHSMVTLLQAQANRPVVVQFTDGVMHDVVVRSRAANNRG